MHPWLVRLRHDLVKRAAWPARDLCELLESGAPARPPDLKALRAGMFELQGDDGSKSDARGLWNSIRADAPAELDAGALDQFGNGVEAAMSAVDRAVPAISRETPSKREFDAAIEAVLGLEKLFAQLAAHPNIT